ncbi:hypothetical protein DFH07DRAFT_752067 [Mycena maculata]|uniref:Uncharacterized protein n=1 Tax=Mycena maculata TaxID=230809 RepID=A0AAD7IDT5_9AGAR|nr:hypothetical protein DFH07DRAFT_752067 [Mycena maculata]
MINRDGWNKWVNDGYTVLEGCGGGAGWDNAVTLWTELERLYRFETSSSALPTKGRPAAVGAWTKCGRQPAKPPKFELQQFVNDWEVWWSALAPAWRQRDKDGQLVQGGDGPWGVLVHPGANGFLMVMLGLAWWRQKEGVASLRWVNAVKDVEWVLSGLLAEAKTK